MSVTLKLLSLQVFGQSDKSKQEHDIMMYSLIFVALGVISLVTMFLQVGSHHHTTDISFWLEICFHMLTIIYLFIF